MTDTNDTKRPAKTLTLKKTEMSTVKQSFSHGRTKAVVVEKKRATNPAAPPPAKPVEQAKAPEKKPETAPAAPSRPTPPRPGVVLRQLTEEEKIARTRALAGARVEEVEASSRKNAKPPLCAKPRKMRARPRKKPPSATLKKKSRAATRNPMRQEPRRLRPMRRAFAASTPKRKKIPARKNRAARLRPKHPSPARRRTIAAAASSP
jgi:translation initiation factor IF-2